LPALSVRLAAAAAAAVLIALLGAGLVMNQAPGLGSQGPPNPSSDAPATTAALQSLWEAVGDRQSPGDWGVSDNSFNVDPTGLRIEQLHGDVLSTMTLADGGNRLVLTFRHGITGDAPSNQQWPCQVGDEGIYSVHLAPDGRTLTLSLVSDPCVTRAAFLPGEWTRSVCRSGYYACVQQTAASAAPARLDLELDATLLARWTSVGERPIPGTALNSTIAFAFEPTTLSMNGFKGWVASDWSIVHGDLHVKLTESEASLTGQHWTCQTGDEGTYRLELSDDEATLTISVFADACVTRSSILVGVWSRCPPEFGACPDWAEHPQDVAPSPSGSSLVNTRSR
jgi:hypothetical protein